VLTVCTLRQSRSWRGVYLNRYVEKLRKPLEKKNADFQLGKAKKRCIRQGCSAQNLGYRKKFSAM
jgi:hypothetical protein